ncbi:hypothetical protein D3C72_2007210 [compost metagenome]
MAAGQHAAQLGLTERRLEAVQAAGADETATPLDQPPLQRFPPGQQALDARQHLRHRRECRKGLLPDETHHGGIPVDGEQILTVLHPERAQLQPWGQQDGQLAGQWSQRIQGS